MVTLLLASLVTLQGLASPKAPIIVSIKGFMVDPVIGLSIDGGPVQDFGLSMTTRHSIAMNKDDAGSAKKLSLDGKQLAIAELESPGDNIHPVLNALGLSVLNTMAIGIDYAKGQITLWPGGRLSEEDAKAWVLRSPKWMGDSKAWKTKIERRAEVAPVIPVTIDGKKVNLLLRVGKEGTSFAKGEEPTTGTPVEYGPGGNHSLLANIGIGPTMLPWALYFRGVSYDPRKSIDSSIVGTFTTENLLSRRVLVDLAGGMLYSEQLTPDAQLSMFLTQWFQLPLEAQGSKLFVREMPETKFFPQLESIYGTEVVEIMGQPIADVLAAARDFTGERRILLKVLFEKIWKGYRMKIKKADGTTQDISFDPPT